MIDPHCHTSSIKVDRPAEQVFELMSDGLKQGHWAWGSAEREDAGDGIFAVGRSIRELLNIQDVFLSVRTCDWGKLRFSPRQYLRPPRRRNRTKSDRSGT